MDRKKVFLFIQSALFIILAVLLSAAVTGIYREGAAAKADDALVWIFSREKIADSFRRIMPLFFVTIGISAAGLILGVKDEDASKPESLSEARRWHCCSLHCSGLMFLIRH